MFSADISVSCSKKTACKPGSCPGSGILRNETAAGSGPDAGPGIRSLAPHEEVGDIRSPGGAWRSGRDACSRGRRRRNHGIRHLVSLRMNRRSENGFPRCPFEGQQRIRIIPEFGFIRLIHKTTSLSTLIRRAFYTRSSRPVSGDNRSPHPAVHFPSAIPASLTGPINPEDRSARRSRLPGPLLTVRRSSCIPFFRNPVRQTYGGAIRHPRLLPSRKSSPSSSTRPKSSRYTPSSGTLNAVK